MRVSCIGYILALNIGSKFSASYKNIRTHKTLQRIASLSVSLCLLDLYKIIRDVLHCHGFLFPKPLSVGSPFGLGCVS